MLDNATTPLKIRFSFKNSSCDHDHLKLNFLSYGNQILGISFQLGTLQWKDNNLAKTGIDKKGLIDDQIFPSGADLVNVRFILSPLDEGYISLGT